MREEKEKNKKGRSFIFTFHNPIEKGWDEPRKFLNYVKKIKEFRYIIFQWEITKKESSKNHFQGCLEIKYPVTIKHVNTIFFGNLAWVDFRKANLEEGIKYVTDKKKELVTLETFEEGNKPKIYSPINQKNKDIPSSREEQWVYINERIKEGSYNSLAEIEKDYPYLVIHHEKKLQEMIIKQNPFDYFKITPAKTIWIYGKSGAGKSCYTEQIIKDKKYSGNQITFIKSDLETSNWFTIEDQEKKVLVIEEVRPSWPRYNSLINWIDRKTTLPVKGSLIRNNFELIIINSLWNPYDLFIKAKIPEESLVEPLRRIYEGKVLEIRRNEKIYKALKEKVDSRAISEEEFKFSLIPIVKDWSETIPKCLKGFLK